MQISLHRRWLLCDRDQSGVFDSWLFFIPMVSASLLWPSTIHLPFPMVLELWKHPVRRFLLPRFLCWVCRVRNFIENFFVRYVTMIAEIWNSLIGAEMRMRYSWNATCPIKTKEDSSWVTLDCGLIFYYNEINGDKFKQWGAFEGISSVFRMSPFVYHWLKNKMWEDFE